MLRLLMYIFLPLLSTQGAWESAGFSAVLCISRKAFLTSKGFGKRTEIKCMYERQG